MGNWEKVLLLFTRPDGALYLVDRDCNSGFFMAGALEEELNSLLKLPVMELKKAKRDTEPTGEQGKSKEGGHQPANKEPPHTINTYCTITHNKACWEL